METNNDKRNKTPALCFLIWCMGYNQIMLLFSCVFCLQCRLKKSMKNNTIFLNFMFSCEFSKQCSFEVQKHKNSVAETKAVITLNQLSLTGATSTVST